MVLTAPRLLVAVLAFAALAAGAYALGRATGGSAVPPRTAAQTATGPRTVGAPKVVRVQQLQPVGALPELRGG